MSYYIRVEVPSEAPSRETYWLVFKKGRVWDWANNVPMQFRCRFSCPEQAEEVAHKLLARFTESEQKPKFFVVTEVPVIEGRPYFL